MSDKAAGAVQACFNICVVGLQGFRDKDEVHRFGQLMDEMCYIVATKHSGSLKVSGDGTCQSCLHLDYD